MRRYIEIYSIMLRNSLIRDLSFKANFLLWMIVEVLWFCGQIVFFSIIFGQVDRIDGDRGGAQSGPARAGPSAPVDR